MLYDLIDESGDVLDTRCFDPKDLPTFQAAAKASLGEGVSWTPSGEAPAEDAEAHVSNRKPGASPQSQEVKTMTIREIDRSTATDLMDEVREELQALCERHGLEVSLKNGKYDDTYLQFKLQLAIKGQSREAVDFERYASRHGLPLDALGKKFSHDGEVFEIVGYNRKATKYTIVTRRQRDEKRIRFTAGTVRFLLSDKVASPAF